MASGRKAGFIYEQIQDRNGMLSHSDISGDNWRLLLVACGIATERTVTGARRSRPEASAATPTPIVYMSETVLIWRIRVNLSLGYLRSSFLRAFVS